ncbi:hypothetical protein ACJJTC_000404 [Scirpophaga incertulas]
MLLKKLTIQELAYQMATLNKIPHPFTRGKAGRASQLTFQTPEPTALSRCSACNRTQVERFYDNLSHVMSQHQLLTRPDDVYNMDETGTVNRGYFYSWDDFDQNFFLYSQRVASNIKKNKGKGFWII